MGARFKDTVLILSDTGHYHSASKLKFSPFSSLKISTNPLLFFSFWVSFSVTEQQNHLFVCFVLGGGFLNNIFLSPSGVASGSEDPISSKSWGCALRLCSAQVRFTLHTLMGFDTVQSI